MAEALRKFWTEKKLKKGSGPITSAWPISLARHLQETGCLQNRPRSGAPHLSEVRTCNVVSQMNTLRKQSPSGVSAPVYSGREVTKNTEMQKISVFRIFNGVSELYPYKLQLLQLLLPADAAKRMAFANLTLWELEENPQ